MSAKESNSLTVTIRSILKRIKLTNMGTPDKEALSAVGLLSILLLNWFVKLFLGNTGPVFLKS